jgi:hypothetical protein
MYLFPRKASQAVHFRRIEPDLASAGRWYTFKPGIIEKRYAVSRPETQETILFVDPHFPLVGDIISSVLHYDSSLSSFTVLPLLRCSGEEHPSGPGSGSAGNDDEGLRWIAVQRQFGGKYPAYLGAYASGHGHREQAEIAREAGIDEKELASVLRQYAGAADSLCAAIQELDINNPVVAVFNNRETVSVGNQGELIRVMEKITSYRAWLQAVKTGGKAGERNGIGTQ